MIYILAYIVLGLFTFIWAWFGIGKGDRGAPAVVMALIWPIVWIVAISNAVRGRIVSKCAWCGKSVGTQYEKDKWRAHYLDECKSHPLAMKAQRLQNYLDETDAKCTHYRVKCDVLESQIYGEVKS